MKRTVQLQLGRSPKNLFVRTFNTEDSSSVNEVMREYIEFFGEYKRTHSITSRRWTFPVVMFKDEDGDYYPKYKITPNGSWGEIDC